MTKKTKLCRRNPLHDHPLLNKGGIHQKTNKAKRRIDKTNLKKQWLEQNIFELVYFAQAIAY